VGVEVQLHKYGDIYKISEPEVGSEGECCDKKCGIHIISSQVQERGTYFPSLQEVYPYAINKHVNIMSFRNVSVLSLRIPLVSFRVRVNLDCCSNQENAFVGAANTR
jgi:hypothetical protein